MQSSFALTPIRFFSRGATELPKSATGIAVASPDGPAPDRAQIAVGPRRSPRRATCSFRVTGACPDGRGHFRSGLLWSAQRRG